MLLFEDTALALVVISSFVYTLHYIIQSIPAQKLITSSYQNIGRGKLLDKIGKPDVKFCTYFFDVLEATTGCR